MRSVYSNPDLFQGTKLEFFSLSDFTFTDPDFPKVGQVKQPIIIHSRPRPSNKIWQKYFWLRKLCVSCNYDLKHCRVDYKKKKLRYFTVYILPHQTYKTLFCTVWKVVLFVPEDVLACQLPSSRGGVHQATTDCVQRSTRQMHT